MKRLLCATASLVELAGATVLPPVLQDNTSQPLPGGQTPVGTALHLSNPNKNGEGAIYYTLDGSDPRDVTVENSQTLVSFNDNRYHHIPTAKDDGFLLDPPLSVAPIARYTFDSDGADSAPAGGSQDAVFSFGTTITTSALTTGALNLNRANEHANLGNPAALQITGPISLSTWAYVTSLSKQDIQYLLVKGPDPDTGRSIFLRINHVTRHYEVGASDENGERTASFPIPEDDRSEWFHLSGVHDGTHWNLYHNGVLAATKPDPLGAIPVAADWTVGSSAGEADEYIYGNLDELYIFDEAITDADAASLYQTTVPIWNAPIYEKALAWAYGPGGHGYSFDQHLGTNVAGEMPGISASIFIRAEFDLSENQLDLINHLELDVIYDDGFVAFLNGVEIHREHAPAILHGQSEATLPHRPEDEVVTFNLEDHVHLLQPGTNVFAVQGLNNWVQSDDFLIHEQLNAGTVSYSVGSSGQVYTDPVILSQSTEVNARVLQDGQWSPLATVDFQTPNLAITKIHYHPRVNPGEDLFPANAYEYIEIQNIDNRPFSMIGLQLEGAVTGSFPRSSLASGQRFILPNDTDAFFDHHPDFPGTIVTNFLGDLPNEPGRIHLFNNSVGTIRDFEYGTASPTWPDSANGSGYCLVLIKPEKNPDHSDPSNWRRSVAPGGTPAESDAIPFTGIATSDNDGDGLTALLEYALGTSDSEPTANPWNLGTLNVADGDGSHQSFQAEIRRRVGTDDVVWIPEASTDLESWSSTPFGPGISQTFIDEFDWVTEQYRSSQPIPASQRHFLRVRVEKR
ncbi:MAG: LamG domain-containing protein [Akkermansiaceae bacterium]